uniref:Uncharacterized protein n=1 Tax=Rhizophora mucronata TaxID=61149 RepID=A0A2P2QZ67_RHIMU
MPFLVQVFITWVWPLAHDLIFAFFFP